MWRCRHDRRAVRVRAVVMSVGWIVVIAPRVWSQGALTGVITIAGSRIPVSHAVVTTLPPADGARSYSDSAGRFALPPVAREAQALLVRRIGFQPDTIPGPFPAGGTAPLRVPLEQLRILLDAVTVRSPGRLAATPATGAQPSVQLTRADLARTPQLGDDAFRAVARVPGVAAGDLSAGFRVRGGSNREVLLSLDGMELEEPFHLKDLDGAVSIIDPAILGGASLSTGGFGARYGDHLTGVFALRSRDDTIARASGQAGASLSGAGASAAAPFAGGRADVLASVRRGLLGAALALAGDRAVAPRYDDAYARVRWRPSAHDAITMSVLHADDGLRLTEQDLPNLASGYGSTYVWASWDAAPRDWLRARTTVSLANLAWRRQGGTTSDAAALLDVDDARWFRAASVEQAWTIDAGPRLHTEIGAQYRALLARYAYDRQEMQPVVRGRAWAQQSNDLDTAFALRGNTAGVYVTQHADVTRRLALDAGVRYDRQSYTGEHEVSPRAAASYAIDGRTSVHAAWGLYAQPQQLYELQVGDGVMHAAPAERAEQRIVGVDRLVGRMLSLRLDAYERRLLRLDPAYVNLESSFDVFPEASDDRVLLAPASGRARGVELSASSARGPVQWSASYALATAQEVVNGTTVAWPYDQRHSVYVDAGFTPRPGWQVTAAWQFHSGWPATPVTFGVDTLADGTHHVRAVYGLFDATRIGAYHRLDLRVRNVRPLGSGRLAAYVDVFNVYGRDNPRGLGYTVADWNAAQADVVRQSSKLQLPRIPTVGVTWTW